jgi:hypothetical protein
MKYILIDEETKYITQCLNEEDVYCNTLKSKVIYSLQELIPNISDLKKKLEENKDMNIYQKDIEESIYKLNNSDVIHNILSFNKDTITIEKNEKDKTVFDKYIKISDEEWEEANNKNANYYDGKKFIYKEPNIPKEDKINNFKSLRDSVLKEVDFYQLALVYAELSAKQKKELKAYRLALLDSTKTQILPTKPDWFK